MKKWTDETEEKFIRRVIFARATAMASDFPSLKFEGFLEGVSNTLHTLLGINFWKVRSLEKKIQKRMWFGKEFSKEARRVIDLYQESILYNFPASIARRELNDWLGCRADFRQSCFKLAERFYRVGLFHFNLHIDIRIDIRRTVLRISINYNLL